MAEMEQDSTADNDDDDDDNEDDTVGLLNDVSRIVQSPYQQATTPANTPVPNPNPVVVAVAESEAEAEVSKIVENEVEEEEEDVVEEEPVEENNKEEEEQQEQEEEQESLMNTSTHDASFASSLSASSTKSSSVRRSSRLSAKSEPRASMGNSSLNISINSDVSKNTSTSSSTRSTRSSRGGGNRRQTADPADLEALMNELDESESNESLTHSHVNTLSHLEDDDDAAAAEDVNVSVNVSVNSKSSRRSSRSSIRSNNSRNSKSNSRRESRDSNNQGDDISELDMSSVSNPSPSNLSMSNIHNSPARSTTTTTTTRSSSLSGGKKSHGRHMEKKDDDRRMTVDPADMADLINELNDSTAQSPSNSLSRSLMSSPGGSGRRGRDSIDTIALMHSVACVLGDLEEGSSNANQSITQSPSQHSNLSNSNSNNTSLNTFVASMQSNVSGKREGELDGQDFQVGASEGISLASLAASPNPNTYQSPMRNASLPAAASPASVHTVDTHSSYGSLAGLLEYAHGDDDDDDDVVMQQSLNQSVSRTAGMASALKSCLSSKKAPRPVSDAVPPPSAKKSVIFGSPHAAEYHTTSPTTSFTPLHKQEAKNRYVYIFVCMCVCMYVYVCVRKRESEKNFFFCHSIHTQLKSLSYSPSSPHLLLLLLMIFLLSHISLFYYITTITIYNCYIIVI